MFFFVNNLHNEFLKALCPHFRKRARFVFFPPPHTVRVGFLRLSLSKPQKTFSLCFCAFCLIAPIFFCFRSIRRFLESATSSVWRSFITVLIVSLSRARSLSLSLSLSLFIAKLCIYTYKYSKAIYEYVWRRLRKRARENASNVGHRGPVSVPLALLLLTIRQSIRISHDKIV